MLRQALDAAEGRQRDDPQQQQQHHQQHQDHSETSSLLSRQQQARPQTPDTPSGYGTHSQEVYDDESGGSAESSEEEEEDDDWSYSNSSQQRPPPGMGRKAWNMIRNAFLVVANVENLWDSPMINNGGNNNDNNHNHAPSQAALRRRSYLVVLFWFFVLAGAYASERSTFKLLVDQAGPFRLFSVEMVTAVHAMMLGFGMLSSNIYRRMSGEAQDASSKIPLGIPMVDVGYMALLDTFHLLLVFLTGRYVCPTGTVILIQFTLPLSAFLTQFVHSDGRCACHGASNDGNGDEDDEENAINEEQRFGVYGGDQPTTTTTGSSAFGDHPLVGSPLPGWGGLSAEHVWGSVILSLAVLVALLPSVYTIIDPAFFTYADEIPTQTAYNTLLYAASCFPAAASQLYKEHVFLQNKQPVNASYLNFLMSLFQFILASVMTPLVFGLQGLGASEDWTSLYPSSHFSKNFLSGLKCFLGLLPEESAQNDFPEVATCHLSLLLVLAHAFSIIAVGCAVDKIINAGATKAMYRGISAGIIIAVVLMYEYDMHIPEFNYGPEIDLLNLICLGLLVVGAEVYHRVSLSDSVFITEYPTVEGLYEDEE